MTEPQWTPSSEDIENARITDFQRVVSERHGVDTADYRELWEWSTQNVEQFWRTVWDYFDIQSDTEPTEVLGNSSMPGAQWFPGVQLNYVDQVRRHSDSDRTAIVHAREDGLRAELSWRELARQTAALARTLREAGVEPGDRVVGYLPNIPEAVVAFLASASVGAVWSACGQDYSASAALDRLGQLDPKVLIAADGYSYGGKYHDKRGDVAVLRDGLTTVDTVIRVGDAVDGSLSWEDASAGEGEWVSVPVAFDHPLWVVFSSGTTGLPKGIVHGHGGVLLEHLKAVALQSDIGSDDTFFWYTSPSWMMWNFQVAGLLVGATIVCADGSPAYPAPDALWAITAREKVTFLGTSPGYVLSCIKAESRPSRDHDLSALRAIGITGSAMPASSSLWLSDNVGRDVPVFSISGGTDVVSAFAGGVRTVPVWPGELSAPFLGVALKAFDVDGRPVTDEVGELVVTEPMPSMPVRFWNDDGSRYREAYFDAYPGVWRHGDWITLTAYGSVVVHGRSDSTLNRNGIRMGSADIYQAVEELPEIVESLVLGVERGDGGYWMPLFVVLTDGTELDDALRARINTAIREHASPRHVPDEIIAAPGVPHTRTGKKLEVPIKRLFQGGDASRTLDRTAVDAPDLVDWYVEQGRDKR
ncbi:acetoacetate--CoA ligase [Rhodococcus sp. BP-252]|uniref:Acetoacetyl-CoA synthetase n=1 Tax=Rhodococcoides kyotonense TaxID=398843 RepID=A0A177Y6M3_9NOCA|nr:MULTISPECIES: acetoacetate--CoA ligase [Rhodococcus]MBY6410475.1 acetoacetate--CoA ligase [Rhodococcus sp. BP-320]MBY6416357.1 acetoacetate--CoA ligase [Rhodococcus sp. BP-321]MBY6420352.1 acetoacetate--CoA ligase [Rhodococcus sp. BP-324]MBY6425031.1 acetoacetate--CoA ligase [Rhodococcus sp. BP-323]MBY6430263.1 acetoacetate--CoA ligase [Rhodococcus sp. BP-322]